MLHNSCLTKQIQLIQLIQTFEQAPVLLSSTHIQKGCVCGLCARHCSLPVALSSCSVLEQSSEACLHEAAPVLLDSPALLANHIQPG